MMVLYMFTCDCHEYDECFHYKIILAGQVNRQFAKYGLSSVFRKGSVRVVEFSPNTLVDPYPNIINCSVVSWFWLTWINGELVFGLGKRVGQTYLFNFIDTSPLNISYMGVASGSAGVSASWFIPAEFYTNGMNLRTLITVV